VYVCVKVGATYYVDDDAGKEEGLLVLVWRFLGLRISGLDLRGWYERGLPFWRLWWESWGLALWMYLLW
jgi:hypothetical protein